MEGLVSGLLALIGVALGILATLTWQWRQDKEKYRIMTFEKRLDAYQKLYSINQSLYRNVGIIGELQITLKTLKEYWVNNALYLDNKTGNSTLALIGDTTTFVLNFNKRSEDPANFDSIEKIFIDTLQRNLKDIQNGAGVEHVSKINDLSEEGSLNERKNRKIIANEKMVSKPDTSNKNNVGPGKSEIRKLFTTYSVILIIAILVLFGFWGYSFWRIGEFYNNFNYPIEVLQGVIIASTALLGLSGTFLVTREINKKGSGKWWPSYVVYCLYAGAIVLGFLCVTNSISTLIDWPLSGAIQADVINNMRNCIRYFFTELFLFGAAFFVSIIIDNILTFPSD